MAGPPCSVSTALSKMTEVEQALFRDLLTHETVSKSEVARALRAAGYRVSGWSLRHHTRKECSCP